MHENLSELVKTHPWTAAGVTIQSPTQPDHSSQFPECVFDFSHSLPVWHNFDFLHAICAAQSPSPWCTRAHPYSDKWRYLLLVEYDRNEHVAPIWPFPAHRSNLKQIKVIAKSTMQRKREFSHLICPKSRLLTLNFAADHTTSVVHSLSSSF